MDEKADEFVSALSPWLEQLSGQRAGSTDPAAITDGTADTVLPAMELNLQGPDAVPLTEAANPVQKAEAAAV